MRNFSAACLAAIIASSCSQDSSSKGRFSDTNTSWVSGQQPIPNWQNLDLEKNGVFGISTEKAYEQLLQNKKAVIITVAVIDSGIDTTQEDLKPVLWTNSADGSHGRNYILKETGKEDFIPALENEKDSVKYWRILADYNLHLTRLQTFMDQLASSKRVLGKIIKNIGSQMPSLKDFEGYHPRNEAESSIIREVLLRLPRYPDFDHFQFFEVDNLLSLGQFHLKHGLSRAKEATINNGLGACIPDRFNNDISNDPLGLVADPNFSPEHGTHMSGIIAAVRNNGKGINGVADHVRIMMLKLDNNIREMRNDNLAEAIGFAVDHGARIISMSFGKTFSWHRETVDKAVQYAMSKGVLLVHSAGNDAMNLDAGGHAFFPSPNYQDGGIAPCWITVGASGYRDDSTLAASFSNYGYKTVDVFAPGEQITSTISHGGFGTWDGTSVATPMVAGLAALIMEYHPGLSAIQVKDIIMKSVVKRTSLKDKCVTGGVVNAYNALKLAAGLNP
jgi:subtilisin family serine protease